MISVIFFVLICSKESKKEMNTKKLHTIVRIVLLSFVLTIIIHHFIFLYHSKFRFQRLFRISRDVNDRSVLVKPTKKILAKFSYPKRILESKISNPKNPSIISVTKNPEYLHWGFVRPQTSLSKVFISAYDVLITAKQIVDYEAGSERPTSKKETTTNGKRTKYLLFFGNRNTLNWKTKHPQLRWKCLK